MTDGPLDLPDGFDEKRSIDVLDLAVRALSILAAGETGDLPSDGAMYEDALFSAVLHPDENRRHSVISKMVNAGVTADEIVDQYAPRIAGRLGSDWVQDKLCFAEVTIGAGRRNVLRATIPLGRSVLMAVPNEENHLLGAFVAASQFRRLGLWVHMAVGQTVDEMVATVASKNFEMIGLSAASRRSLPHLTALVSELRERCDNCPPIVIGGQILKLNVDICEIVGADLATSNPREAAEFCGLLAEDQRLGAAWASDVNE